MRISDWSSDVCSSDLLVTAINWQGARAAGRFQIVTLAIKLIPLVTIVVLIPIAFGRGEPVAITPFPAEGPSLTAVSGSAILTLWALLGFESASVAADKVENPTVTIPRATIKIGRASCRDSVCQYV